MAEAGAVPQISQLLLETTGIHTNWVRENNSLHFLNMPRLCINSRKRVVALLSLGFKPPTIYYRMQQEKVDITLRAIYYLVQKYRTKGKECVYSV